MLKLTIFHGSPARGHGDQEHAADRGQDRADGMGDDIEALAVNHMPPFWMNASYTQASRSAVQVYFRLPIHKNSSATDRHRHRKTVHSVPLTRDLQRSSFF